ncbi:MAG: hypothetical protein ACKO9B_02705 [Planctomycetota bacterium]|nr:hypothetical protein [Planctomycetota bacterium]
MESLPFSLRVGGGLVDVHGMARNEGPDLVLEFQTADGLVGILRSAVKTITIPVGALAAIEYRQSLFSTKVVGRVRHLRLVQDLPGSRQGQFELLIDRRYRTSARRFVADLEVRRAEEELRRVGRGDISPP